MKTKSGNIVDIEMPKKSAFTIETSADFIKLQTLMCIVGKRGGGKTLSLCNFLKEARAKGYADKVIVVTPTYNSNKGLWDIAGVEEEDVYDPDRGVIAKVKEKCEAEKQEWEDFLQKKELYKQFKKDGRKPVHQLRDDDLIEYFMNNFYDKPPTWKYDIEQPPRIHVVLDDCLNTPVMSNPREGLINLCIRHRHINSGDGISIYMLVQSYCSIGGVPRVVRENCTNLLLFKINQEKQIQKIKEEADLEITEEEFEEMLETCHSEDFQFLMLDFASKCPTKKYRKGWNEYLIPATNEGKCKCKKNNI